MGRREGGRGGEREGGKERGREGGRERGRETEGGRQREGEMEGGSNQSAHTILRVRSFGQPDRVSVLNQVNFNSLPNAEQLKDFRHLIKLQGIQSFSE